jgi:hypothetical protein
VPAGQRLIVQQVSAIVTVTGTGAASPVLVELRDSTVSDAFQFLPVVATPTNFPGQTEFIAHASVLTSFDAGEIPTVGAFLPSGGVSQNVLATITGYMVTIP